MRTARRQADGGADLFVTPEYVWDAFPVHADYLQTLGGKNSAGAELEITPAKSIQLPAQGAVCHCPGPCVRPSATEDGGGTVPCRDFAQVKKSTCSPGFMRAYRRYQHGQVRSREDHRVLLPLYAATSSATCGGRRTEERATAGSLLFWAPVCCFRFCVWHPYGKKLRTARRTACILCRMHHHCCRLPAILTRWSPSVAARERKPTAFLFSISNDGGVFPAVDNTPEPNLQPTDRLPCLHGAAADPTAMLTVLLLVHRRAVEPVVLQELQRWLICGPAARPLCLRFSGNTVCR